MNSRRHLGLHLSPRSITSTLLLAAALCFLAPTWTEARPAFSQSRAANSSRAADAEGQCRTVASRILARAIPYCVILPPGYTQHPERRYPVLYYLHGLGDNEQMFLRSGGFDLVQDLWDRGQIGEFVIVTPAGYASFFINSNDGSFRYEDFLSGNLCPGSRATIASPVGGQLGRLGAFPWEAMGRYTLLLFIHACSVRSARIAPR